MGKLLLKNTDLNNILKDYSICASTNSYILTYNANMKSAEYSTIQYVQQDISKYLEIDATNRINNFEATYKAKNNFNFTYTYSQSDYNILPNSLIISNLSIDGITSYDNSYIVFYNTSCGLKQLSYYYQEGNGLYYDNDNHIIGINIDNNYIKEVNKKLYFNTNSLPIASDTIHGIAYVDNQYLKVNNGILTINSEYIDNVISYKYKIKDLYNKLNNIYSSLSYYNMIYETKNNTIDKFDNRFGEISNQTSNTVSKGIQTEISYNTSNSLYFPGNEFKYIDNYYFNEENPLIDPQYKQFIQLNDENSYIIYCKDLEKIELYSYIENKYSNYGQSFNINKIIQLENINNESVDIIDINNLTYNSNFNEYLNSLSTDKQEIIQNNDLYTYIYINEQNIYNKSNNISVSLNIINKLNYHKSINPIKINNINNLNLSEIIIFIKRNYNDNEYYEEVNTDYMNKYQDEEYYYCLRSDVINYTMTKNVVKYNSNIDKKIFKKLGIILNSKISIPTLEKDIIQYTKNENIIKYDYTIQNITCKYNTKNIKVIYDDRNITYCTYNTQYIPYNGTNYYFLSDYNTEEEIIINKPIAFMLKNIDISFDNKLKYLFYGYSWIMKDDYKFNKKYYGIWNELPTCFITTNFMKTIQYIDNLNSILLNNFKELYTENFDEVDFDIRNKKQLPLYLYKLYEIKDTNEEIVYKISKVKIQDLNLDKDITINI